jgi:hypothetical protein
MKRFFSSISKFNTQLPSWTGPLAILLAGIGAYGLFITRAGFYWDEWPFLWFDHAYGPDGVVKYFNTLRPFLGYFYAATIPVLGTNSVAWQVFGIFTRCLAGLSLWWLLKSIWPERKKSTLAAAILFMVFPSFSQQYIAIMWSHLFVLLAIFFCSLTWLVLSLRQPERRLLYLVLSLATGAISLFTSEYWFGLELLRPFIFGLLLAGEYPLFKERIKRILLNWLPYLLLVGVYLFWRVVIYKFPTYQPEFINQIKANPLLAVAQLALMILHDLRVVTLDSLLRLVYPIFGVGSLVGYILIVLVVAGIWIGYFRFAQADTYQQNGTKWKHSPLVWAGLITLLLAGIPFMVTSLPVEAHFPNDRFTLPYIPGACLLLVGLIESIPNRMWLRAGLMGLLVGLACGVQYQYGGQFVQDRQIQNDFLWQLQWRAPGIQPGTMLISEKLPHLFESDNSLTAAVNWMYAPEFSGDPIPYLVSYGSVRLKTGKLKLEPDTPIVQDYRVAAFRGNSSQAIVMYNKLPGCVRLLEPERDKWLPNLPNTILKALPLSRLDLVQANPARSANPPAFLGTEPAHGWCYYFEKADLAISLKDWQQAAKLGDQVQELKLEPGVQSEWIVFIQGYALSGRWQDATDLTRKVWAADQELKRPLCTAWGQIERQMGSDPAGAEARREVFSLVGCE